MQMGSCRKSFQDHIALAAPGAAVSIEPMLALFQFKVYIRMLLFELSVYIHQKPLSRLNRIFQTKTIGSFIMCKRFCRYTVLLWWILYRIHKRWLLSGLWIILLGHWNTTSKYNLMLTQRPIFWSIRTNPRQLQFVVSFFGHLLMNFFISKNIYWKYHFEFEKHLSGKRKYGMRTKCVFNRR